MNYRKLYKEHYGIDFGDAFVVHHIDFDRENNDIENLLLLPRALHQKYHFYINALQLRDGATKIDYRLDDSFRLGFAHDMLKGFLACKEECKKWIEHKAYLDLKIHNEREEAYGS